MNPTQKQFSLNRGASRKQIPISNNSHHGKHVERLSRNKKCAASILALSLSAFLCGCISIHPPSTNTSDYKIASEKNYTLNVENSANVGEPIIVRKSYTYQEVESLNQAQASNDFEAKGSVPLNSEVVRFGKKGDVLQVFGTTTIKKTLYRIVIIGFTNNGIPIGLLVTCDTDEVVGAVWRNGFGGWGSGTLNYSLEPSNTRFSVVKSINIEKNQPYENFEIIFTGQIGQNASFLYREYSKDDLARPAFYQNLTYNLETEDVIRFKKLKIQVVKVTNESIQFKVLSDL